MRLRQVHRREHFWPTTDGEDIDGDKERSGEISAVWLSNDCTGGESTKLGHGNVSVRSSKLMRASLPPLSNAAGVLQTTLMMYKVKCTRLQNMRIDTIPLFDV